MNSTTRRTFFKQAGGAMAVTAALGMEPKLKAQGANDRVVLGVIGPGGMGMNLLNSFVQQPDVEIAYVCDPDSERVEQASQAVEKATGRAPKKVADMRRVFEDRSVDAVVVATPDHWHAPATILACQAGKHVYVEKPCSHNIREGRLMIEAAKRHRRIVQVGMQSRSTPHVRRAIDLLHHGAIGEILSAKAWNSQLRRSIGHAQPSAPPAHLDFDLWLGPAPEVPYQSNLLHSIWRWWYPFGCGDIGNDGVHDIDIARWGLGVDRHPSRIAAMGGKYFFDDDQQFPDTQYVLFEYQGGPRTKQLIFEQRIWSPYVQEGFENGDAFYGTEGMLILGKSGGWKLYGRRNELVDEMTGRPDGPAHHRNFLDCLKTESRPNADIEVGHLSASLCHLGNIATRRGQQLSFDGNSEQILNDSESNLLVQREYRTGHWAIPARG